MRSCYMVGFWLHYQLVFDIYDQLPIFFKAILRLIGNYMIFPGTYGVTLKMYLGQKFTITISYPNKAQPELEYGYKFL